MAFSLPITRAIFALFGVPFFPAALTAILFAMLAEAMAFSYIALLAVDKIGMSPLQSGAFLSLSAISGIVVTTIFGHFHDRKPMMWPLLISLLAKMVGFGLCAVASEPWMLFLNAAVLFGISSASFSLLFATAKGYLDRTGEQTSAKGMAALRTCNSLSWAVGPALGAILVRYWDLDGIYVGAALLAALALAVVLVSCIEVVADTASRQRLTLDVLMSTAPSVLALTAFHTAMFTGANAVSIVVAQQLGSEADVGLLFSLCALLEVIVMSLFVFRPARGANRLLLLAGFGVFGVYYLLPIPWPSLTTLYLAQLLRATGIAIISIVGMAHLQDLLPGRAGIAAALFGNSANAGLLFSGLGTGLWAQSFGYWSLFELCVGLCLLGAALCLIRSVRR
ncbi:MFS transporter [Rhizobium leguminosarum]|uniref:MFS transporter n=1 Tax=Rhizobium leguminosarum TaxID=384 RepID=UPI001C938C63|nr:MFS transporter [Rhizobium leguminosarum]MBY5366834.1 MFS transporter [Rhizobium leguminosarum]MBY5449469.1 MFS transporter [Rhizobium leguminosarum]